jgi:membrane associated rhomboid family serine protease
MKFKLKYVAVSLIAINVAMFILQQIIPKMTDALLLDASMVWHKPWLLLTSMFLHADITHLLFNMYSLLIFGMLVEQRIGSNRFLGAYLISGIIAGAGATFFYPRALGASGAIMSLLGLTIILMPDLKVLFFFVVPMTMRTAGIIFAAIDVIFIFIPTGVANIAHLIGLACGLAYGYYLMKRKSKVIHRVLGVEYAENTSSIKKKKTSSKSSSKKTTIELTDDEIEEYMNKGHL